MHQGNFNRGSSSGNKSWEGSRGRNSRESQKRNDVKELPQRLKPRLVPVFSADQLEVSSDSQLTAKEVLIGNLPPEMHQCDVYKFCIASKVSALHVEMKTIDRPHYSKVYYALVYVRSDKDVKELVSGLGELVVNGYMLVAYSAEKLKEECQIVR